MSPELQRLVEATRHIEMTPEQLTEQRRSFAYGNTHIENDRITREMVAEADQRLFGQEQKETKKMRNLRLQIVFAVARILRVPIKARDTWWGAAYGVSEAVSGPVGNTQSFTKPQ